MQSVSEVADKWRLLREGVDRVIMGQESVKEQLLVCLLAGGHALLEGVPGTGKTLLALTLSRLLGSRFRRIQFTPDLMPADLLGTSIYNQKTQDFEFRAGPIFADLLLADEINRTPPRTQAALLESMQEKAVTLDGERRVISPVFTVLATQNPIEFEGTYPLPEAQRDRFLLKISIDYPEKDEEAQMLSSYAAGRRLHDDVVRELSPVLTPDEILVSRDVTARAVRVEQHILGYILGIVTATRHHESIQIGAGPRASLALLESSRALAVLRGRDFVTPDDVKELAGPVMVHRVILTPEAEMEGTTLPDILRQIFEKVEVPPLMRPGRLLIRALLGLCFAALLVPFAPVLTWVLALGLAVILGIAAWEALALRRMTVTVERPAAWVLPLDEEEGLPLRLTTTATRPVRLTVRQTWPRLLEQPSSVFAGTCRPGEMLMPEARVRAVARGAATIRPPWVAATFDGWMERFLPAQLRDEGGRPLDATEVTVLPNLRAVKRMRAQLDRLFLQGFGSRAAPRLGKGRDFDRLREYVIGDDLRDVAWKASARHRKLITREYRLDRSQDILVCLDRGHRMAARVAHVTRLDHAVNAAVLLASICNRMEDRVGLLSFADSVEQGLGQGRGSGHLRKITAFAAGVMPEYLHTDYLALGAHLRRRMRTRSLVLILTSLPEMEGEGEIVRAVEMLVPQHLPVVIVFSDPAMAAAATFLPEDKPELCRTLVARDLWIERRKVLAELRRRGALVAETAPGDAGVQAVNSYLEVKRRQLL